MSHADRRRTRCQTTPTHEFDMSEEVRRRVEQRLWQLSLGDEESSDDNTSSD